MKLCLVPGMAALAALAVALPLSASAATSEVLDPDPVVTPLDYELDTVLIVRDWILCTTSDNAERIAKARLDGEEAARRAYDDLAGAKACGRFARMGVMLHEELYPQGPAISHEGRVFAAMVNIGVGWQSAFVVSGGPPEK